jgi:hypothetical protein
VYLLARRLLPPWWSVAVTALSLAIPSSVYVSLVLTESVSYLVAWVTILAIVLALEHVSAPRQLAVLGAVALATLTRAQFAVLFAAYVAGLVALWLAVPARRPRSRRSLLELWPTLVALAAGVVLVVVDPLLSGGSPTLLPGAYDELWEGYDPLEVAKWLVYHLAALELYVAVVPLAVAPIVLALLLERARRGSAPSAAFASAFLTVNASLLLVAAAFSSTEAGLDHLHDRYLFYVVLLWLVCLAVWLHEGLPRPVVAMAIGAALALVLPAVLPFSQLAAEELADVDAIVTHLWAAIQQQAVELAPGELSGRRVLAVVVVTLVAATVFVPRRLWLVLAVTVASILLLQGGIAWRDSVRAAQDLEGLVPRDRTWVDRAVPEAGVVASLYVAAPCLRERGTVEARLLTEFFNRAVGRAAHLTEPDSSLLPSTDVRIAADGTIVRESGGPFEAEYVLAPRGIAFDGRALARGTPVPLVVWRVDSPLRLARARSAGELDALACAKAR